MTLFELLPRTVNPDTEWITRNTMINYTSTTPRHYYDSQGITTGNAPNNCYVDPTNPYNPWGPRTPYVGDVPPITWQPPITITYPVTTTQTTSTSPLQPGPLSYEADDDDMTEEDEADEDQPSDFAGMIRDIVRDELSKQRTPQPSAKDIAREVMAEMTKQLRAQGRR